MRMAGVRIVPMIAVLIAVFVPLTSDSALIAAEGKRYAVLVGVENYLHPKLREPAPLKYSVDDALSLAEVLKERGYVVTLMTDDTGKQAERLMPTRANIEREIAEVLEACQPEDTVVLAFAGHGHQFQAEPDAYFCPMDARPFKEEKDSLVSINDIYRRMEHSFAGVKVILVDACRNDPNPARGRGLDADAAPPPPKGVGALFSCSAGQRAYEHDSLKHGVFFHFVLEGLKGGARDEDGEVTFETLSQFVRKKVPNKMRELDLGTQQPNLKADLVGAPPVLVAARVGDSLPAPKSPVETQSTTKMRAQAFLATDRLPAGGTTRVAIRIDVPDKCYVLGTNPNHSPFDKAEMKVTSTSKLGVTVTSVRLPTGLEERFPDLDYPVRVVRGTAWIVATLAVPDGATGVDEVSISVKHRLDTEQVCYAPESVTLRISATVAPSGEPVRSVHDTEFRAAEVSLAASAPPSSSRPSRTDNALKLRLVEIDTGLWMGATEVTQSEWSRIMGTAPWTGKEGVPVGIDYPAVYLSWNDAREFCDAFTRQERKSNRIDDTLRYRLPSVPEWERACRAGGTAKYAHGDDPAQLPEFAWFKEGTTAGTRTAQRVAGKRSNPWGMFDMHGNVSEWCQAEDDADQPHRGGSFLYPAEQVTASSGAEYEPTAKYRDLGFRVVLGR
jgi:formylglycine-generating enzyme required for sulfatase activity/uncharacterized caspase-like protein